MAKHLVFLLFLFLIGCEMNSEQLIKSELTNFENIKFNAVSKELKFSGGDLYTYIIKDVERYLSQNIKDADGYGLSLKEIGSYLKILEYWKSEGYEEN